LRRSSGALNSRRRRLVPARSAVRAIRERQSVVLAYHGVDTRPRQEDPEFMCVHPDRFRAQVELLMAADFSFVTVAQLAEQAAGGPPPAGLAALSFDDGLQDNHRVVLPLLREYGVPATVYVATGLIGGAYPWMSGGAPMLDEDEIRELAEAGVEIGAHTVTHPDLAQLDRERCLREMSESRQTLEQITGHPVRTFAYPYCRYGDGAVEAAREAGFLAAVTCQGRGSWDRLTLKRAMITGKDGLPSFVLKLAGAYQPLFDGPPGRLVRGVTRPLRRRVRALIDRRG
jgi:peptidoglycan/xylan/chitin deacetylase (PgdA/CDA1 family)